MLVINHRGKLGFQFCFQLGLEFCFKRIKLSFQHCFHCLGHLSYLGVRHGGSRRRGRRRPVVFVLARSRSSRTACSGRGSGNSGIFFFVVVAVAGVAVIAATALNAWGLVQIHVPKYGSGGCCCVSSGS